MCIENFKSIGRKLTKIYGTEFQRPSRKQYIGSTSRCQTSKILRIYRQNPRDLTSILLGDGKPTCHFFTVMEAYCGELLVVSTQVMILKLNKDLRVNPSPLHFSASGPIACEAVAVL